MPENERIKTTPVRVAFRKTGSLSFISHLDLLRTVSRLLVRADIGVYYTEGFNPHPKLAFALPLSVGTESVSELFDIKVMGEEADYGMILRNLRREAPPELEITDAYAPVRKFRDIAFAEYDIVLHHRGIPDDAESIIDGMMADPIVELKRTKSGERECDIRPFIASLECGRNGDDLSIKTRLSADSEHYLNPEYIVKAVKRSLGLEEDDIAPGGDWYTILRTGIFDNNGDAFR